MRPFVWNPQFDTGIDTVDEQHRHLVDLINRIVTLESEGKSGDAAVMDVILGELTDYASYHFQDEESLMDERGVAPRHATQHQLQHSQFIDEIGAIWEMRNTQEKPLEVLHGFLSSWLSKHILEEDQSMARQMELIAKGMTPDEAYKHEHRNG